MQFVTSWKQRTGKTVTKKEGSDLKDVTPPPGFFASVASKEFSFTVSLLFATLAGRFISVAAKGLTVRSRQVRIGWEKKIRGRGERITATSGKEYHESI